MYNIFTVNFKTTTHNTNNVNVMGLETSHTPVETVDVYGKYFECQQEVWSLCGHRHTHTHTDRCNLIRNLYLLIFTVSAVGSGNDSETYSSLSMQIAV